MSKDQLNWNGFPIIFNEDSVGIGLKTDSTKKCSYDPMSALSTEPNPFMCPYCGEQVTAGMPHP